MKYVAQDWRRREGLINEFGKTVMEVLIDGHGWCEFSWATGGIKVNGKWIMDWEDFINGE